MANLCKTLLATIALTLLGFSFSPPVAAMSAKPTGFSEETLIEIGRRIYQAGEQRSHARIRPQLTWLAAGGPMSQRHISGLNSPQRCQEQQSR
jgi:hypothetical protein